MGRPAFRRFACAAFLASLLPLAAYAQSPLWSRAISGAGATAATLGDGRIVTRNVALDASGNILVTGSTGSGSAADMLTTKLAAASGSIAWQKTLAGAGGGEDHGMAVAADGAGNAIVAGLTANAAGNSDIAVVKYSASNGAVAWQKTLDAGSYDGAYAVAADGSGNVVVGAESTNAAGNVDIRIVKLSAASGAVLWDRTYDGGGDDFVSDLALDGSGNALVSGTSVNAAGNNDFTVLKVDGASGAIAWHKTFDWGSDDAAYAIAVDKSGNALVAGASTGAGADFRTLKLAGADGALVWQQAYDGGKDDYAQAIAVDSAGNAIVTGQSQNAAGNSDFRTLKYAAKDGAVLWQQAFDGGGDDFAYYVALDPSDNAIVVGSSAGGGGADWKIVAYASADGAVMMQRSYAGSAAGDDIATQVVASATGIVVAGSARETGAPAAIRVEMLPALKGAASITSPAPGGVLAGSSATFQWNDAGATLYQVWVGSSVGAYDIGYFPTSGTTGTSTTVKGLPTDGRKLYVRLYSYIGGNYVYRDFTYTAAGSGAGGGGNTTTGGPASITSPADGSTLSGSSTTFQWTDAGAALYQLWLGNSVGNYDIGFYPPSGTTTTSTTATGIPTDGRKVYARLYSNIDGAYVYRDFTYTAAGSGGSPPSAPSPASITSPASGSTLPGTTVTFQWNDSGASLYQLWVGSSPGTYDVGYFPAAGTAATSIAATGLPTDGRTLYVRLYSAVNGAWQYRDFTYNAAGSGSSGGGSPASGPASMASPAAGSTLHGSSVTFQWNDAGASLYQVWVGTSPGAYDIGYYPATGTTSTSTTATGLPTDGRTLYVRLYSAIGDAWQYRDYTYRSGP